MSATPAVQNGQTTEKAPPPKKPVQLHLETLMLLKELKGRLSLTTDQVVRTALLKLQRDLGDRSEETAEQKMRRLAGLGDA